MIPLENWFYRGSKKHPMWYMLVKRTDKVALFKLFIKEEGMEDYEHVGWEVSRIVFNKDHTMFGNFVPAKEGVIYDDGFGVDGSSAFFQWQEQEALKYFDTLDRRLHTKKPILQ